MEEEDKGIRKVKTIYITKRKDNKGEKVLHTSK